MSTLDYEGVQVTDENLGGILRDAAHDTVPVRDVEAAQNPRSWVLAFALDVGDSPLRPALIREVTSMFGSQDLRESALALALHDSADPALVSADALWPALFAQSDAGRFDAAVNAARGLHILAGRGQAIRYTDHADRVRALLLHTGTPRNLADELLAFAGGNDRAWLAQHFNVLQADNDHDTLLRIGEVASTLGSADLEQLGKTLDRRHVDAIRET